VFRTERGTPVNPNHASRAFARLAASVGLAAHPHLLRFGHRSREERSPIDPHHLVLVSGRPERRSASGRRHMLIAGTDL
jgi:hypothetical protein